MRTVTYGGAVSLDGFLAGADGSIDWLHFSKDVQDVTAEYWKDVDTILMGRKTYEVSVSSRRQSSRSRRRTKDKAHGEPAIRAYVFSRTLNSIDDPNIELVKEDAVEFVGRLKRGPGKGICLMGGGELAQSLLAADLVDRIGLNIHPILLGSGIPTFRDAGHRIRMKLEESRLLDGGCILATYRVIHAEESAKS
jgi:dihydrofolate reductase